MPHLEITETDQRRIRQLVGLLTKASVSLTGTEVFAASQAYAWVNDLEKRIDEAMVPVQSPAPVSVKGRSKT